MVTTQIDEMAVSGAKMARKDLAQSWLGGKRQWGLLGALAVAASIVAGGLAAQPAPSSVPMPVSAPASRPASSPAKQPATPKPSAKTDDPIGALLQQQAQQLPVVIGTRLSEQSDKTRFVVELSDPVEVHVFTLTGPDRVVIDLPEVLLRITDGGKPSGKGVVSSYRYGLFRKGNSRFVIDLAKPVRVGKPQLLPPENGNGFRLVLDLTPTTAADFAAHAGWPQEQRTTLPGAVASAPEAAPDSGTTKPTSVPKTSRVSKLVVIDPGHGGIDPGTHGSTGLQEKSIVLAVGKKLRDDLQAAGYKVVMTRDSDVFIPLRERVNIARAAQADLFVSLHVDSNDHHDVRGASIYTLSEDASDREAAKLADKENMSDVIAGVDLSGENSPVASILIDLAQRETMNRSVRFAETALSKLSTATMVRPTSPHRSAGFAVLKGPDVPAVLIEMGYLSNTQDEGEMASSSWRSKVAEAITQAVNTHFQGKPGIDAQQAANP
jgi:N-acetylmuramoyl-L-alanine amidase